jgi:hypothetical protein
MDMEITLQTSGGIGMKPLPIKNILLVLFGVVSCFLMLTKTDFSRGNILHKAIFVLVWAGLCFLLLRTNKMKQLGVEKISSIGNYIQPDSRFVSVRASDNANNMVKICGFDQIGEDGMIKYTDKSYGVIFDIIGNASILLFDDHKNAILDRVDNHYRKIRPNVTYQFITRKEPQNIFLQVASLEERYNELTCEDPDLTEVFETEKHILSNLVGHSFKSLHQYLIIQAPNEEELNLSLNIFYGEVENSELMFKYHELLDKEEALRVFTDIYGTRKEY